MKPLSVADTCIIVILVAAAFLSPPAVAEEVALQLAVANHDLVFGDPLLMKVTVHNRGTKAIRFTRPFGTSHDTLRFELREPGNSQFRLVATRGHGSDYGGVSRLKALNLDPDERQVSYEMLLYKGSARPVFSKPGQYDLRVNVAGEDGIVGASNVVTIAVTRCPAKELRDVLSNSKLLFYALGPEGISVDTNGARLAALYDTLSEGPLRSAVGWTLAILAVRDGQTDDERRDALRLVLSLKTDDISKAIMSLNLARQLYTIRKIDEALRVLEEVTDDCHQKGALKYEIAEYVREGSNQ